MSFFHDDHNTADDDDGLEDHLFSRMFINTNNAEASVNVNTTSLVATCEYDQVESSQNPKEVMDFLCSELPFCFDNDCICETIWNCKPCKRLKVGFFVMVMFLLGVSVTVANAMVIFIYSRAKAVVHTCHTLRVSLAVADLISGIIILTSVPHTIYTASNSNISLINRTMSDKNTLVGVVLGSALLISYTSSIYHLMVMSIDRMIAVEFPLTHNYRIKKRITVMILATWIWSLVIVLTPAWFPTYFAFSFQPALVIYSMDILPKHGSVSHGVILLTFSLIIPFLITIITTTYTTIKIYKKVRESKNLSAHKQTRYGLRKRSQKNLNIEMMVIKTTVLMIMGFSITLAPLIVFVIAYHSINPKCKDWSLSYTIVFYVSMCNRDKRFKIAVRRWLCNKNTAWERETNTSVISHTIKQTATTTL